MTYSKLPTNKKKGVGLGLLDNNCSHFLQLEGRQTCKKKKKIQGLTLEISKVFHTTASAHFEGQVAGSDFKFVTDLLAACTHLHKWGQVL